MIDVFYYGVFFGDGGYQRAATSNVFAMEKISGNASPSLNIIPKNPNNISYYKEKTLETMSKREPYKIGIPITIIHKQPLPGEEKDTVLKKMLDSGNKCNTYYYTVFECDRIPKHFVKILKNYKNIIVPSNFCKEAFEKDLPECNIDVVPHVIHNNTKPEPIDIGGGNKLVKGKRTSFVSSISQVTDRKGMDLLLKAYLAEFTSDDDVELLLHVAPLRGDNDRKRTEDFISALKNAFYWKKNTPPIMLVCDILTDGQMVELYKYGDFFVSTSRGEGFGLQVAEAVVAGTPVIYPNYGAFPEYMYDVGHAIDVKEERVISTTYGFDITHAKWGEPTIDSIMKNMRMAWESKRGSESEYKKEKEKTLKHRDYLLNEYSYEKIGERLWTILERSVS